MEITLNFDMIRESLTRVGGCERYVKAVDGLAITTTCEELLIPPVEPKNPLHPGTPPSLPDTGHRLVGHTLRCLLLD